MVRRGCGRFFRVAGAPLYFFLCGNSRGPDPPMCYNIIYHVPVPRGREYPRGKERGRTRGCGRGAPGPQRPGRQTSGWRAERGPRTTRTAAGSAAQTRCPALQMGSRAKPTGGRKSAL
eukprot:1185878-Prorocentrum_minimum.AAC.3